MALAILEHRQELLRRGVGRLEPRGFSEVLGRAVVLEPHEAEHAQAEVRVGVLRALQRGMELRLGGPILSRVEKLDADRTPCPSEEQSKLVSLGLLRDLERSLDDLDRLVVFAGLVLTGCLLFQLRGRPRRFTLSLGRALRLGLGALLGAQAGMRRDREPAKIEGQEPWKREASPPRNRQFGPGRPPAEGRRRARSKAGTRRQEPEAPA